MLGGLITRSDRWNFIATCNKSTMKQPKSNWHHFVLQAQHSSSGRVSCNMVLSKGNVFPPWKDFVFALRKQFYPLGYKEKDLIE
jgi:hypothetical protein